MAEDDDAVAGFYLRVTRDEEAFVVAYDASDGHAAWYVQVFHRLLCDFRPLYGYELGDISLGSHEEFHVMYVGIEHHLVDM